MTQEQLNILYLARKAMDGYLPQTADSAVLAQEFAPIMRPWIAGTVEAPVIYALNDLRTENGVPYKCTTAHTHSGESNWNPAAGSSLWRRFHGTTPETAWEFTADSANPYLKDEYCIENDKTYKCLIDNTVYAPSVLPANWEELTNGEELDHEPEAEVINPWEQRDGSNPYKKDAKVSHNDKIWISTVDSNVWEPGIYGWEVVEE